MGTTINQRIADLRKAKRLTQKQFAEKLNVSDKLVSKWEQDGNTPALEDIVNISKIFKLTLDYLIHGKESKSDTEALKPTPQPLPLFVDPIQTLVKKIDEIVSKNKLQKYKEQLFPSASEDLLYDIAERVRKETLEDWNELQGPDAEYYTWGIYRDKYCEDRRNSNKPIDEKYWAQVEEANGYNGREHISKEDKRLLKNGFGIFIIDGFGYGFKKISNDNEYRLVDYDISFSINFNAMLALDNCEIYQKLSALGIPLYMSVAVPEQAKKSSGYFDLTFEEKKYYEIFNKLELRYPLRSVIQRYVEHVKGHSYANSHTCTYEESRSLEELKKLKDEYVIRDLQKAPLTYNEFLGLTDVRFFNLLQKEELDLLLDKVNLQHKRVWEVIATLIDSGATKKKLVKSTRYPNEWVEGDDPLSTLMLREFAKMKLQNKE